MRKNIFHFSLLGFVVVSIFLSVVTAYAAREVDSHGQRNIQSDTMANRGGVVGINPQSGPQKSVTGIQNPGVIRGFNPQPEPPGKMIKSSAIKGADVDRNSAVANIFNSSGNPGGTQAIVDNNHMPGDTQAIVDNNHKPGVAQGINNSKSSQK